MMFSSREMELNDRLGPAKLEMEPVRDQTKIIGPIKFLLENSAQGDSYRDIISQVNSQIILMIVYNILPYQISLKISYLYLQWRITFKQMCQIFQKVNTQTIT